MGNKYEEGMRRFYGERRINVTPGASLASDYELNGNRDFYDCSVEMEGTGRKGAKPHVVIRDASDTVVLDVGARSSTLYRALSEFVGKGLNSISWVEKSSIYSDGSYLEILMTVPSKTASEHYDIERIYLDTETTGLDPQHDEILQLSIIDGSGNVLWDRKYRPEYTDNWPEAQRIHHISPQQVASCPYITDDLEAIQSILDRSARVYAFNAPFDFAFLGELGLRINRSRGYDTMRLYGQKFHGHDYIKLVEAAHESGYAYTPHDALADCRATLAVQARADGNPVRTHMAGFGTRKPRPITARMGKSDTESDAHAAESQQHRERKPFHLLPAICLATTVLCILFTIATPSTAIVFIPLGLLAWTFRGHLRKTQNETTPSNVESPTPPCSNESETANK